MRGSILLWLAIAVLFGIAGCSPQKNVLCKDYCDRQDECCDTNSKLSGCPAEGDFDRKRCRRDCPEVLQEQVLSPKRDGGTTLCTNQKERRRAFQETCLYEDCENFQSCIENQIPDCEG